MKKSFSNDVYRIVLLTILMLWANQKVYSQAYDFDVLSLISEDGFIKQPLSPLDSSLFATDKLSKTIIRNFYIDKTIQSKYQTVVSYNAKKNIKQIKQN